MSHPACGRVTRVGCLQSWMRALRTADHLICTAGVGETVPTDIGGAEPQHAPSGAAEKIKLCIWIIAKLCSTLEPWRRSLFERRRIVAGRPFDEVVSVRRGTFIVP
jgi:hypothetical protein